jgi:hypothetical protein
VYGTEPSLLPGWTAHVPQDIDDTQYNSLCRNCHNDLDAPDVKPHSGLITGNNYGDWAVECRTCHNPHQHTQFRTYGGESYLHQGIVSNVTETTLTESGAGWPPDEYKGFILIPNAAKVNYNYQITGNTSDTLTVKGTINLARVSPGNTFAIGYGKLIKSTVTLYDILTYIGVSTDIPDEYTLVEADAGWAPDQYQDLEVIPNTAISSNRYTILNNTTDTLTIQEPMDLTGVDVGDIFKILAPKTGDRAVKYFRTTGANSFADIDPTYNNGVCEVCHTQTTHFRNDGQGQDQLHNNIGYSPAGTDCTICHKHVNGFMGMGGGVHDTHVSDEKGPQLFCNDCHGSNVPPILSDGQYLANTTVCDTCHSPGGSYDGVNSAGESIGAKDYWDTGVYDGAELQAGKEKWCAGCHDEVPSVINSISAPNVVGDEDGATRYGTGYGFYKTGHGLPSIELYPATGYSGAGAGCLDCHDATTSHIDGDARTYQAEGTYLTYDPASANYQNGYRLIDVDTGGANGTYPMHMPRTSDVYFDGYGHGVSGFREDWEFALCFSCHDMGICPLFQLP